MTWSNMSSQIHKESNSMRFLRLWTLLRMLSIENTWRNLMNCRKRKQGEMMQLLYLSKVFGKICLIWTQEDTALEQWSLMKSIYMYMEVFKQLKTNSIPSWLSIILKSLIWLNKSGFQLNLIMHQHSHLSVGTMVITMKFLFLEAQTAKTYKRRFGELIYKKVRLRTWT